MDEIKTSQQGWLQELSKSYREQKPVRIVDDAHIGIDPQSDSLLTMGWKAKLTVREWFAVAISLGVSVAGAYLLVVAIVDEEPFSKIAVALITGAVLLGSGGFMAVRILTKIKPPNIKVAGDGFEINWN
jgi:hypothetical protein